jgi:hypothetical protein
VTRLDIAGVAERALYYRALAKALADNMSAFFAEKTRSRENRSSRCAPASGPRSITTGVLYVIDLTHYLDARGAIAPERGPARKLADFVTGVVAHATDFDRSDSAPGPLCFKCRKSDRRAVETAITEDDRVIWRCMTCGTEGQISNWQRTFWDLS